MFSSQKLKNDILFTIYQSKRTIFRLNEIAMLTGESDFTSLNQRLNYHVRTGKLVNPRKGIYAKHGYNKEELACAVYSPCYISLEYVLQKHGVIFQYDSRITMVSYLTRNIEIEGQIFQFRKIKEIMLVNTTGIEQKQNHVNIATAERAFLDTLYLSPNFYFDNTQLLNKKMIFELLPCYQSQALTVRVNKILKHG